LESFLRQKREVEIVVSDNASSDGTIELMERLGSECKELRYHRSSVNLGADSNYLRAVALAQSDYCWLFGSDDTAVDGSIDLILEKISYGPDVILCNRFNCDKEMNRIGPLRWTDIKEDQVFDTAHGEGITTYLKHGKTLGSVFSYLSSVIVKKQSWDEVSDKGFGVGTAYAHTYVLLSILVNGGRLCIVNQPLVNCRTGNDSFLGNNELKRIMLDFAGYEKVGKKAFAKDTCAWEALKNIMRREHPWYRVLKMRRLAVDNSDWLEIVRYLNVYGYSNLWIRLSGFGGGGIWIDVLVKLKSSYREMRDRILVWLRN